MWVGAADATAAPLDACRCAGCLVTLATKRINEYSRLKSAVLVSQSARPSAALLCSTRSNKMSMIWKPQSAGRLTLKSRELIDAQTKAAHAKNVNGNIATCLMLVVRPRSPPQYSGLKTARKRAEGQFTLWQGPLDYDLNDLSIRSRNVGLGHKRGEVSLLTSLSGGDFSANKASRSP